MSSPDLDRPSWAGQLLLVLAVFLAYLPALDAGFIWDDDVYVTDNVHLADAAGLARLWLEPGVVPQYYPLVHTSFWIERALGGTGARLHHLTNIALHALAALLLWRLLARLGVPGAWLVGFLFALHPVQVESVAWITERKNVLSAVFYLGSALAWLRHRESPGRGRVAYAVALVLFVAALLSKTVTGSLPAALLLWVYWQHGRLRRADVVPLVPWFALAIGSGLGTAWMERHVVGAIGLDWQLGVGERLLVAGRAVWFYLGKLLWPEPLLFIYPRWRLDVGAVGQWLWPLATAVVLGGLFAARHRIGRGPLVAALFFGGTLVPALGFFDVYPMRYSFVADHFQYLACIGPLTLLAAVLHRWWRRAVRSRAATGVALVGAWVVASATLALLGGLTWQRCHAYADAETLWLDTIAKDPDSWMALNNLGLLRRNAGQLAEAIELFQRSVAANPDNPSARANLGTLLAEVGQAARGIEHLQAAVALQPEFVPYRRNLATAALAAGDVGLAVEQLTRAVALDPTLVDAHAQLGRLALSRGDVAGARAAFEATLRLRQDDAEVRYLLAMTLASAGDVAAALPHFEWLADTVGDPEHWYRLGLARSLLGQGRPAVAAYDKAVALRADGIEAFNGLAWLLATHPDPAVRDGQRAVELARRASELSGEGRPEIADTLGAALAEAGEFEDAIEVATSALEAARAAGDGELAAAIEGRLEGYRQGRPFREGD